MTTCAHASTTSFYAGTGPGRFKQTLCADCGKEIPEDRTIGPRDDDDLQRLLDGGPGFTTPERIRAQKLGGQRTEVSVNECPKCGQSHAGLFLYRGHQGRGDYVFCPTTRKPFVFRGGE